MLVSRRIGFIFDHFVYKRNFGQIWIKIIDIDPLELEIAILVLVSQIMVFHFEYKKDFRYILVKFIVYTVFLSSSRYNKKQKKFQLVGLATGRL